MPRPRKERIVKEPPRFQQFKPAGIPARLIKRIILFIDEFEALRLADYEDLEHKQAADKMGISRPTFTRLIDRARKKITKAIIEGKEIFIEGGSVNFRHNVFQCMNCGYIIQINFNDNFPRKCPECGSTNLINLAYKCGLGRGQGRRKGGKRFRHGKR